MSGFGFISGEFGFAWSEVTKNNKTIHYFSVQYHKWMGDKRVPQTRQIKVFDQKGIDKVYQIQPGSYVEVRLELGGRTAADGRIYNEDTLDFAKIDVISDPIGGPEEPPRYEPPAPKAPPPPASNAPAQPWPENKASEFKDPFDEDIPF